MEQRAVTFERTDHVEVRLLLPEDLDWVVGVDEHHGGSDRRPYYEAKLESLAAGTSVGISLAAFVDGRPCGFLLAQLYEGEFGQPEPVALLDTIGVAPEYEGQRVALALMGVFLANLRALGIDRVQTQVDWEQQGLLGFFKKAGFSLAPRLCLERRVD